MIVNRAFLYTRYLLLALLAVLSLNVFAGEKDFPEKPTPPRLVNDFAGMLNESEEARLEAKLLEYEKTSSTQITVVTIKSLGSYDISDYAVQLGRKWGIGQKDKNNGVLLLASLADRAVDIEVGYGLEGSLTDAMSARIIRNEIVPEFKNSNFYSGFDKASDAIIAATKGEYKADEKRRPKGEKEISAGGAILIILIIYLIIWLLNKFRGGGGSYMSGRGHRGWGGGPWIGGGGFGGGSWGGGSSGGGFGGFGGGSFGGGGASGRW